MATDLNNSYNQAKNNLAKLKTFTDTKNSISEALSQKTNQFQPPYSTSTFQNDLSEQQTKIKKQVSSQFDQMLDLVLSNRGSGTSTSDYLIKIFLVAIKELKNNLKNIIIEEIINSLGCDLEQTFDAQKIYIKVSSIDIIKILKSDPDGEGKILYEFDSFSPTETPRSTNRMFYNLIQNPNEFYSDLYMTGYLGVSGAELFNIRYVQTNPLNGNSEGWYEVDLFNRPSLQFNGPPAPNKVSQFLVDYYETISLLDFRALIANLLESIFGIVSIQLGFGQATIDDSSKFGLLVQRIFGLCFDQDQEISVGGVAKTPELDDTTDSFFDITGIDTSIIEQRTSEILRSVVTFESCENVELPVDSGNLVNIVESINFSEVGSFEKTLNKISVNLSNDPNWSATFPFPNTLKLSVDFDFIKKMPLSVVSTVMSPKVLFPFILLRKSLGLTVDEINTGLTAFLKSYKQFSKNLISRIGSEFVKILFEELKKDIRILVRQIILDILKEEKATVYLMIERLVNLAKKISSIVKDFRQCKSVIDAILQLFDLVPSLNFNKIPLPLLQISELLPGYSTNRAFAEVISEHQKLGLPTGPLPDGSPNLGLQSIYSTVVGMDREAKLNGKVQASFSLGTPSPINKIRITGKWT
jgi:hypothetical protein